MIGNLKRINERINYVSRLIAGCSSHKLKTYTMKQLRKNPRPNLIKIIQKQAGDIKVYNEKTLKLRWELRQLLRELRNLIKENV